MSRSHKDRHQWKRKERKRTGKRDPQKIKLHRERFLQRIKERSLRELGYGVVVFRSNLSFDAQTVETIVKIGEETIGTLPYLVENVADCHFLLAQHEPKFDAEQEKRYLKRHVAKAKRLSLPCHLEMGVGEFRQCSSVIECPYRKWNTEKGTPECTK